MGCMLLICASEEAQAAMPEAEMSAIVQGHMRFAEELRAAGKMVVGERLRPEEEASRADSFVEVRPVWPMSRRVSPPPPSGAARALSLAHASGTIA